MDAINQKCLIIILNWNGSTDTVACCKSLLKADGEYDVLIIDNNSTKTQYEQLIESVNEMTDLKHNVGHTSYSGMVENKISNIDTFIGEGRDFILFKSEINHGFSIGCNIGAKFADEKKYENILFLNNDTVVEPGFLEKMNESLTKCDGVIPQIRFDYDRDVIWNCGGTISRFGNRKYFFANQNSKTVDFGSIEFNVTFATGCCLLFRTEFFIKIGLFTEKYFFGEEDIDLSLRLLKNKAKIICRSDAIIYHKVGASLSGDKTRLLRKAYIHYLNRFINMKHHLGIGWFIWIPSALLKVVVNTIRINKLSVIESLVFSMKILKDALVLDEVNKDKFERVLKSGY